MNVADLIAAAQTYQPGPHADQPRSATALDKFAARTKNERRFPRTWVDEAVVDLAINDYIKGVISAKSCNLIYGPSGCGKTFFTIDMALHIATGRKWRGRRVRQCLVVYVAAEAGVSVLRRFAARQGSLSKTVESRTPLAIITRGADLLNKLDVEALIAELQAIASEVGLPVGIVVFDTFSRSIAGGDENSAQDVTQAIAVADQLRDELGASTLFVHHTGKDASKGPRGHSSLFAAMDTVISVSECVATIEKARDGTTVEIFPFRLEVVKLGTDSDGDKVTTCVVVPTEAQPKAAPQRRLRGAAQVALQALQEAVGEHGKIMPETSTIPRGVRAVTLDQWRDRFVLRYGADDAGTKRAGEAVRKAFQRGREELLASSAVSISDPYCWCRNPPSSAMQLMN